MVVDENDNTPMCTLGMFSFATDEANSNQIVLGSVTATDGDNIAGRIPVGSGQLVYQLASTNLQNTFTVTPSVSNCMMYMK